MSHVASVGPAQRLATSPRETESAPDIAALLRRLVDAAVVGFSGAAHACVTLSGRGGPSTVVFSDALALTMDCRQYKSGQGPCPEAAAGTPVVVSNDLTGETRWPSFSPVAVASGIGSVVCFGLGARGRWFGSRVSTGERRWHRAQRRSRPARRWLLSPRSLAVLADRETAALRVALASRDVIGQAKGILMERFQISSDEAFRMLVRWSQNSNVKLRAVAAQLVWSGELPMGGGAPRRTAPRRCWVERLGPALSPSTGWALTPRRIEAQL